jgi:hypothetical protein
MSDLSIYDGLQDDGFENMGVDQLSIPLLLVAQPTSTIFSGENPTAVKQGDFYNSNTGKNYGSKLKIIPCYFKIMWFEWMPDQGGLAGKHEIGSVEVEGNVYDGMYRVDHDRPKFDKNGKLQWNEILETWIYFVILPEFPEDGFLCYNSTSGNIKYLKKWNADMKIKKFPPSAAHPNGFPAPMFAGIWEVETKMDKNDKGVSYHFGVDGKSTTKFVDFVPENIFLEYVKPVRELAPQSVNRLQIPQQIAKDDAIDITAEATSRQVAPGIDGPESFA